jgi:hypothetical protein
MYNNSFWQFKKWLSEAKQKKMRGGSPSYQPPEAWTNVHGDTRRKEYIQARKAEEEGVKKKTSAAVDAAKQVPDHGVPENIHNIITSGSSRELEKHSFKLRSSKNPKLKKLGDHLQDLAHRRSKNPPHPQAPESDYDSVIADREAERRERAGDPGRHFPFYPNQ